MSPTCKACDERRHGDCDGIAIYMEQDGFNRYTCRCYCRREVNEARERKVNLVRAERFLRELGLDRTHELVEKVDAVTTPEANLA